MNYLHVNNSFRQGCVKKKLPWLQMAPAVMKGPDLCSLVSLTKVNMASVSPLAAATVATGESVMTPA